MNDKERDILIINTLLAGMEEDCKSYLAHVEKERGELERIKKLILGK